MIDDVASEIGKYYGEESLLMGSNKIKILERRW